MFALIDANLQDTRASVAREMRDSGLPLPVLMDRTQTISASLGIARTCEALVVDPASWRLVYKGPVTDRDGPDSRPFLDDAIAALLAGRTPTQVEAGAHGCAIAYQRETPVTFDDIAPVLAAKCLNCHSKGNAPPARLATYEEARGWAAMIREVVRTRRMPPWGMDPEYGRFFGDSSLTDEEARDIVRWVEAGAPRGEGATAVGDVAPPAPPPFQADLTFETTGAIEIPAQGFLPYEYYPMEGEVDRDIWVDAIKLETTNDNAFHHLALMVLPKPLREYGPDARKEGGKLKARAMRTGGLVAWAPRSRPLPYPKGSAFLVRRGSHLAVELHAQTSGRPEKLKIKAHLRASREKGPLKEVKFGVIMNRAFTVPAQANGFEVAATDKIERDISVYRLEFHMHLRGTAMKFVARSADGTSTTLASMAKHDVKYPRSVRLKEPLILKAGTALEVVCVYDNSSANPANPDPARAVSFGPQLEIHEMCKGEYHYVEI